MTMLSRAAQALLLGLLLVSLGGCLSGADPDDVAEINRDLEAAETGEAAEPDAKKAAIPAPSWADGRKTPLVVPLIDVNPDEDYTLGPQDELVVAVEDLRRPGERSNFEREVSNSGKFRIPMAGEIQATGKTTSEIKAAIRTKLKEFLVDPQVSVTMDKYRAKKVMVMGSVNAPGVFAIPKNRVSLIEALSLAKGLNQAAGRSAVLTRASKDKKGAVQYLIDLEHLLTKGKPIRNFVLEPGDVLNVPVADQVFVIGYVHRPGSFPLQRRMTALELVSKAGGWLAYQASPGASFLRRRKPDGNFDIIPLDFDEIVAGQASDVVLIPGDTVVVPQTGLRTFGLESWAVIKGRIPGAPPVYR